MKRLEKKTILITGAGRGIGRAIAILAAKEGADVIVNYLKNKDEADRVVREICDMDSGAIAFQADVSDGEKVSAMAKAVREKFNRIDGIVNNASAALDYRRFIDLGWDDFKRHIEVQLHGAFNVIHEFLPLFPESGGSIVNIASSITMGASGAGLSGYATAKYGLIGLTNALAQELRKKRIRVNAISPGFIETDLVKNLPRIYKEISAGGGAGVKPDDVAEKVVYLLSDESKLLNGVNLKI